MITCEEFIVKIVYIIDKVCATIFLSEKLNLQETHT